MPPAAFRDIAIVGIACRFPGADNPDEFWKNLIGGVESIARFTDDELLAAGIDERLLRDPNYVKAAPVIADHDGFDAEFFGYSPREARLMDPQHRHFLEVAWEAFEDAGYDPMGDNGVVAVYAGAGGLVSSYLVRQDHPELRGQIGDLGHIGNDRDFLPSRVAYKLGLTGPAVNIQTACSTSLVAVHFACRALLDGEAELALAGASVVRVPHIAGYLAEPGAIASPDGHCRAFDAEGAGTLFGSGVAAVLLKPLAAALRDGDRVYAVVKGSAVTNDGAVKVNYTASTATGQARAMSEALTLAGVAPDSIGFVECHGTATTLGDPVEIQALTRAFRTGAPRTQFCAVGSVKSNFGHLEQCAGMAGLIKAALALDRGLIPPSLHYRKPNPRIPFARSPFFVNTQILPFPQGDTPRRAAVNSVGMGGTNAFVVLEESPASSERPPSGRAVFALALSAKNRRALTELAAGCRARLASDAPIDLGDLCFTANCGRHHFAHRFCAVGSGRNELAAALEGFAADGPPEPAAAPPGPIAFLYSGQGVQYPQMGEALYRDQPVFRAALDRCLDLFEAEGVALRQTLFGDDEALLSRTLYAQPALFSIEIALGELWHSWGIVPDIVLGHSVGEFAAAVTAGVCSIEEAAHLVAARARLMEELPEGGAMVSIAAGLETVSGWLAEGGGRLAIGAENAADRTVVSGNREAIAAIFERSVREGIAAARLKTSHAFHSPLMEPMLDDFAAAAAGIAFRPPKIPWVSTMTGEEMTAAPGPQYWRDQVRQPVKFRQAVEAAVRDATTFLEIGPGATLTALGPRCAPGAGLWLSSLGGRAEDWRCILEALAALYCQGRTIAWKAVEPAGGRRVRLPTYPFQHERYWLDTRRPDPDPPARRRAALPHPLLGDRLGGEDAGFEALLHLDRVGFLGDHRVSGQAVLPTAAMLDWLTAAGHRSGFAAPVIEGFVYERALTLAQDQQHWVMTTIEPAAGGAGFRVQSTGTAIDEPWLLHASGRMREAGEPPALPPFPVHKQRAAAEIPVERFYRFLDRTGLSYGPAFRGVRRLWRTGREAFAQIALPSGLDDAGYSLHPAFLDAALHVYAALVPEYGLFEETPRAGPYVPVALDVFRLCRPGVERGWVHAVMVERDDSLARFTADIAVYREDGAPVALLRGLAVRRMTAVSRAMPARRDHRDLLYTIAWREAPLPPVAPAPPRHWYIVADRTGIGDRLAHALAADGATAVTLSPAAAPLDKLLEDPPRCPVGIVYLGGLDLPAPPPDDPTPVLPAGMRACGDMLDLAQTLDRARDQFAVPPLLRLATRGADRAPLQGLLWGLGRSFALEYPEMWGGLIDLPADATADEAADLLRREIQTPDGETELRYRGNRRWAARFVRLAEAGSAVRPVAGDASYWIVGGLGRLGLATAQALVAAGARHLVLTGRGAPDAEAAAALGKLADEAEIRVLRADVADEWAVAAALREIAATMPPLKGVIHAAAVFEDALLANADRGLCERVLRPKLAGVWNLHRATLGVELDFFVLFSSVLSLWGGAGQGAYTAANGFLDALAHYRRTQGLPASVFNWGPWENAARGGAVGAAMWKQRATTPLPPEICLDVLLAHLGGDPPQIAVTDMRWPDFLAQFNAIPPLYREMGAVQEPADPGDATGPGSLEDIIAEQAARVLGLPRIDPARPLNELGLDSLLAVTLANRLRRAFDRAVPTAALLKGPSVRELAAQLFPNRPPVPEGGKAAAAPAARVLGNRWLVFHRPNPKAKTRLFAFPFAGGGAATFRPWADRLDPAIELVAIEPPGRQTRIDEAPLRDLDTLVNQLVPELLPVLDKPFAVYGHCLGALTLFESVRRLIGAHGIAPTHVFVSGARPPDQLQRQQDFEDDLAERLLKLPEYDLFEPIHRQPDEVFVAAIRRFNVPATAELAQDAELRRLILPAIRAEFEMASNYRYEPGDPWDVPITCLTGAGDTYVSAENARSWARFTKRRFQLFTLDSEHFIVVDDDGFLLRIINRELTSPV